MCSLFACSCSLMFALRNLSLLLANDDDDVSTDGDDDHAYERGMIVLEE